MLKRLLVGLVLGGVIGAVVAAVLVQGLGVLAFSSGVTAYLAAAATGALAGLVAGKPIWSAGGRIEAGLKAFFGLVLALGGMFVLRTWVNVDLDLNALHAGSGHLGELPAASLPIIAAVLAGFFELDNTPGDDAKDDEKGESKDGKASASKKVRVAEEEEASEEEEAEEPPSAATKKR